MSNLVKQLKQQEGLRLKPYKCTAEKLTIGYGRNLEDRGITQAEAMLLLKNDIADVMAKLSEEIPFYLEIGPVRRDVLTNMAFQLGVAGLLKFKKTLLHVKNGEFEQASIEMLDSRWAEQTPNRANVLSEQMRTGRYQQYEDQ